MPHNLELKAADRDPAATLAAALAAGAVDQGRLHQRDTYFAVKRGRLKLRQEAGSPPLLIAYERTGDPGSWRSEYYLIRVDDAGTALVALTAVCGVTAIVVKQRHLLIWETVRIHLDEVAGVGSFVELEAVGGDADAFAHIRKRLRIRDADLIESSYGPTPGDAQS
jgi:adenylate cyclase class IV